MALGNKDIFEPVVGNLFRFRCHKEIPCFTECCADLKLILTPYDILRIKKKLGLRSEAFLERYTDMTMEDHGRFPLVLLRMNEDEKRRCPFVTPEGCSIYEDRPGACRIYPIGRAALKLEGEKNVREKFFVVTESHCLGFEEDKEWTIEEWMASEGVDEYNAMNDQWMEIITSQKGLGAQENLTRKIQMFYLASYNLDRFRDFIFGSRFFRLFNIEDDLKEKLASDDAALMKFGFDWLKFSLFGEKTLEIRQGSRNED